jgi:hypothetical protein
MLDVQPPVATRPPRPSRRRPRRRTAALLAGALAMVCLAAACKQDNTPLYYTQPTNVIMNNFVTGCMGGSTGTTLASEDTCQCMFDVVEKTIPASSDDLKKNPQKYGAHYSGKTLPQIESDIKNDPSKIPSSLTNAWAEQCSDRGFRGTTTTAGGSGGGLVTTTTAKP